MAEVAEARINVVDSKEGEPSEVAVVNVVGLNNVVAEDLLEQVTTQVIWDEAVDQVDEPVLLKTRPSGYILCSFSRRKTCCQRVFSCSRKSAVRRTQTR
jgi:hypothetical protein